MRSTSLRSPAVSLNCDSSRSATLIESTCWRASEPPTNETSSLHPTGPTPMRVSEEAFFVRLSAAPPPMRVSPPMRPPLEGRGLPHLEQTFSPGLEGVLHFGHGGMGDFSCVRKTATIALLD